ncbi:MAG TPA: efflux RND transporter periplasmic adaptor subunit [Longimicrobium sp.]|nr:efflux RND transporter periplasmic adaptor subunit [Longimicrobium sp.]
MTRMKVNGRAALAAVALLGLAACGRESDAAQEKAPEAVEVGPEAVAVVQVQEIRTGPQLSGTLSAEREAQVRAQVGGQVLEVYADQGQAVRSGQPLARIDASALTDAATSASTQVRSAELSVQMAQRNYERAQTLNQAGAMSDRDLETARNQLAQAQASLAGARSTRAGAAKQLGNTTVRAPITGIVATRPVSAGDIVQPGAQLFTVVDPQSMRLAANVPADQLGQLQVGSTVRFTVNGYPGRAFTGTIQRIAPAADPTTRQVPVVVTIPNAEGVLVSGLFAEGRVESQSRQGIMVPAAAVDERGVAPAVLRLRGGKAERVAVTLGLRDGDTDTVEITGGVAAGDTLLVGAALGTTPGTRVTVRAGGAAPAAAR